VVRGQGGRDDVLCGMFFFSFLSFLIVLGRDFVLVCVCVCVCVFYICTRALLISVYLPHLLDYLANIELCV